MYAIIKFWRDLGYYGNSVSGRHLTKTPNGGFLVSGTKGVFKTDSSGSFLWNYSGVWGAFSARQAVDGSVIVTGPGASEAQEIYMSSKSNNNSYSPLILNNAENAL